MVRKHRVNPGAHRIRLLRMARPFRLHQLSHVSRTARLRNLTPFENEAQLALAHRVETGVYSLLIPDKRHGGPLEAPSLTEGYRLVQMRRGAPHKEETIRRANRRDIPRRHLRNRDCPIMPNRATAVSATGTRMLKLSLVVPRRISVDDVIPFVRKWRVEMRLLPALALTPTVPQR